MSDQQLRRTNMELVGRYIDAINRWDLDAQRSMLHPDMVYEMPFAPPGFDRRIEGAENYLAFEKAAMDSIAGSENLQDLRVESLSGDPGELIAFFKSDMVFRATGRAYRNDYISHWIIRDGRITYFGEYLDPIRLTVALGGSVQRATLDGPGPS